MPNELLPRVERGRLWCEAQVASAVCLSLLFSSPSCVIRRVVFEVPGLNGNGMSPRRAPSGGGSAPAAQVCARRKPIGNRVRQKSHGEVVEWY